MAIGVVLFIVGLVVVGLALFALYVSRANRTAVSIGPPISAPRMKVRSPSDVSPVAPPRPAASFPQPVPPAAPAPLFDVDLEPAAAAAAPAGQLEIRWSQQFDPRSGTLDETARLRLIGDLGVIAKEWCVPLLCQAYEEEARASHRQAALIALAACRSRAAGRTFERALASSDAGERAIATDALADLEPPVPRVKPRHSVERL